MLSDSDWSFFLCLSGVILEALAIVVIMGSIALTKQRQYVIVLGGSYVGRIANKMTSCWSLSLPGTKAAEQLSLELPDEYHVVLIEKNSHFQHIFAFPRFAVTTDVDTHKAFIPYGSHTFGGRQTASFIQARVTELNGSSVHLDRQVELNGSRVDAIPYAFLVIATGTKLSPPSSIPGTEKLDGVGYLRRHAETVRRSSRIVIIGGGAVGVQTATDIKELYPSKDVTLIHSRKHVMNTFDPRFHDIIAERFAELGIESILGSRVKVPSAGFPVDAQSIVIECEDGTTIPADFVVRKMTNYDSQTDRYQIISTGQTPQSELMTGLSPNSIDAGFIKTLPTLQLDNPTFPNIFVVGDVAATRAHKAAKP